MSKIVKLIFKTHLDIGFTGLAATVIRQYLDNFIPTAIQTAAYFKRQPRQKFRYRWTVGSWLVNEYLERTCGAARRQLEVAIADDTIVWHALPFTPHSELAGRPLFEHALTLSKRLDERFGKRTIAAKLTDVPGHTRGIIGPLVAAGVKLLHIGVNPASALPETPPVFRWCDTAGHELIVVYSQDYGAQVTVGDTRFVMRMTGDNLGAHTPEQVETIMADYPGAVLGGATLNDLAAELELHAGEYPVLTCEIGDTWIHGLGTDPRKVAEFKAMERLSNQWPDSPAKAAFRHRLLMIIEHTWGLDEKNHFRAPDAWRPDDLNSGYAQAFAASWQEKRDLVTVAVRHLPAAKRREAGNVLAALRPQPLRPARRLAGHRFENDQLRLDFDAALGCAGRLLFKRSQVEFINAGLFTYQTFDRGDYERFLKQYLRLQTDWAIHDFSKPDLPAAVRRELHAGFPAEPEIEEGNEGTRIRFVSGPVAGFRQVVVEYCLDASGGLELRVLWFGKERQRLPHAAWMSLVPATPGHQYHFSKLGEPVDPGDVISGGARTLHAVESVTIDRRIRIDNLDAPLVAPGAMALLDFHNRRPDTAGGVHFNLYNNIWGTNFPMWFDDDMLFRFKLSEAGSPS